MQTKTLFSQHYLQNHLPDHPEWDDDPRPVFQALRDLWKRAREYGDGWNEAQTEQEFIQPVLGLLGWSYFVQPGSHAGGRVTRPDYALFPDETAKTEAMPHQGHDDAFYSRARAIAEAKYWGRPLSQKDTSGRETWKRGNPSHQMVSYLVGTRVPWGILTNGLVWRLYSREVSSTASEFYEVDLGLIFDFLPEDGEPSEEQLDQFRRWWLFFRQASFAPDAQGRTFVQRVHEGSSTYAREISDKLKELVFEQVMPEITGGFVAYRYHELGVREETEEGLRQVYQASLSLLYKLLFLLYAEARALLPVHNPGYREQSLTKLARWAAERLDQGLPLSSATHAAARYDALLALFHRIDQGDPGLAIPRSTGGLFNPASPENRFLESHKLSDRAVARAVDTLVRDAGQPVDYAYIGVRNLGAIYEGLLENKLRVVDAAAGQVELVNDKGERKATGSYYTPDYVVEYIVQHTLDPILEERDGAFRAAMDRCAGLRRKFQHASDPTTVGLLREQLRAVEREAREAFLGVKVLDPAMGSGHFLVNAVDHLTDAIIRRMQAYHDGHPKVPWDWNPIQRLIERVRVEILEELDRQRIRVDPDRLDDTALLTRLVMKRCIYGVDLNPMAVELAKVSLWLHTFTVGAPLSFLDHHLRWGNSLIGADVRTVERAVRVTETGQFGLFAGPFAGLLDLTGLMIEVVERADATLADVRQSAEDFERFQRELTPYKQVLDLWVSQYFGNDAAKEFLTVFGNDVLPAVKGERKVPDKYKDAIKRTRKLWREKRFFHWDLEFPEVFVDLRKRDWAENPGFDAVIGNPPWINLFGMSDVDRGYFREQYNSPYGKYDIYVVFVEVGLALSRGLFGMIVPNRFLRSKYGTALRNHMLDIGVSWQLTEFSSNDIFEDVTTYPCIAISTPSRVPLVRVAKVERPSPNIDDLLNTQHTELPPSDFSEGRIRQEEVYDAVQIDTRRTIALAELVQQIGQGVYTGAKEIFVLENPSRVESELLRPVVDGADLERFGSPETRKHLIYPYLVSGKEIELLDLERYPRAREYLSAFKSRLLKRKFWGESIASAGKRFYEIWNPSPFMFSAEILYAEIASVPTFTLNLEGNLACLKTCYCIVLQENQPLSLHFLLSLLNSKLLFHLLRQRSPVMRGGKHYRFLTQYVEQLPIHRVAFTTPSDERTRLVGDGTAEATEFVAETAEGAASASSVSFSDFSDSAFGQWLDQCLSPIHTPDPALVRQHNGDPLNQEKGWQLPEEGPVEQSDVVHDLLAHLAERMIEMHKERQRLEKALDPFKYLDRGAPFVRLTEAFAEEIKYGQLPDASVALGAVCHDVDGLRLVPTGGGWELQVRLKKRDPGADWRAWQYEDDGRIVAREWVPVYHLSLGEGKALYYQQAFRVLDDFADFKPFPGGYTRSTMKKLQLTRVPAFDPDADLAPLVELSEELAQVQARIAATDRLIDLIVYRLYGLTEDEVAVVVP